MGLGTHQVYISRCGLLTQDTSALRLGNGGSQGSSQTRHRTVVTATAGTLCRGPRLQDCLGFDRAVRGRVLRTLRLAAGGGASGRHSVAQAGPHITSRGVTRVLMPTWPRCPCVDGGNVSSL